MSNEWKLYVKNRNLGTCSTNAWNAKAHNATDRRTTAGNLKAHKRDTKPPPDAVPRREKWLHLMFNTVTTNDVLRKRSIDRENTVGIFQGRNENTEALQDYAVDCPMCYICKHGNFKYVVFWNSITSDEVTVTSDEKVLEHIHYSDWIQIRQSVEGQKLTGKKRTFKKRRRERNFRNFMDADDKIDMAKLCRIVLTMTMNLKAIGQSDLRQLKKTIVVKILSTKIIVQIMWQCL